MPSLLFPGSLVLQFRMISVFRKIRDQVNERLPAESRISEVAPSWRRTTVVRLHKQFFPNSQLPKQIYPLWWGMSLLFLAALACVVRFK